MEFRVRVRLLLVCVANPYLRKSMGNRTPIFMAIGPAIGHMVKRQSDSQAYLCVQLAFCAISSVHSDSDIFSPVR